MDSPKAAIVRMLHRMGYDLVSLPARAGLAAGRAYEPIAPLATYSPWNLDAPFQEVLAAIEGHTLVDTYRCYELWKLVEQSAKLDQGSLLEVGVWRGGTGALLAAQARRCGIPGKVHLCDTFKGVVKVNEKDSAYRGQEHADTSSALVDELLRGRLGLENFEILEGIFPEDTGPRVAELTFRFCHIDVDVYQSAKDVVAWIWDRLVPGGILVFDDFGFPGCDGITKCVEEQAFLQDRLVLHNLNGHAIIIKRP